MIKAHILYSPVFGNISKFLTLAGQTSGFLFLVIDKNQVNGKLSSMLQVPPPPPANPQVQTLDCTFSPPF